MKVNYSSLTSKIKADERFASYEASLNRYNIKKILDECESYHQMLMAKAKPIRAHMTPEQIVAVVNVLFERQSLRDNLVSHLITAKRLLSELTLKTETLLEIITIEFAPSLANVSRTATERKAFVKAMLQDGYSKQTNLKMGVEQIELYLANLDQGYWSFQNAVKVLELLHKRGV